MVSKNTCENVVSTVSVVTEIIDHLLIVCAAVGCQYVVWGVGAKPTRAQATTSLYIPRHLYDLV